jgi:C1A family cysteine protease
MKFGYAIEQEKRDELRATSTAASRLLTLGDLPDRVDPRRSELAEDGYLKVEDQLQIGSCQGQSLSDAAEYAYTVKTGRVVQLSRMYAYLVSQIFDGISGDRGSTLSGGTKAALEGLCLESTGPYPNSYPGRGWITQAMKEEAKKYRLKSHTEMKSVDDIRRFIGSGAGIVQIGISWGNEMTPDSSGCIKRFTGVGGGGHAVCFAGYVPDEDVGVKSTAGYWILLKNSWNTRWGKLGYAYVDPSAIRSMLSHRFTVMYGRSDMDVPDIRTLPHSFTAKGGGIRC